MSGKLRLTAPFHVQIVEALAAARIEHDCPGLAAHADEVLFGKAARLAVRRRFPGDVEIPRHVD